MINADAATVFDVLADPAQHPLFDGSQTVKGRVSGPPRLYLGAKFAMRMRWGAPYLIRLRVVEFEEDRRIAWRHPMRHIWRYELTPVDDGTEVTESFDYSPSPAAPILERAGIPDHNQEAIETSLQQLKVLVESRAITAA
ncbi:MAG TPA: SRPBCC family protein [Mycobacteriales bacterium]|nr:SRPBCC family protein [Mycobacteriales bacterium]